ncbi:hypothetical protein KVV02_003737 [Mortierella alpina]|uniref:precorrin-2 dehydrogenase n=1 Tax=Mortierella alpina TaxID=64518 RepID=A0A9P8A450_MORAP|nr:hypothetical protein KVV02_003737 [Mortierella alpina]
MVRSAIDPIRPGASLILAWQIKQKHVVIIGGGFVAAGRLVNVLEADARVTIICPENEELSEMVAQHLEDHAETTRLVRRPFQDSDLTTRFGEHQQDSSDPTTDTRTTTTNNNNINNGIGSSEEDDSPPAVDMVLSAIDDIPLSTHIYHLSKRLRIPVNIADVPPQCDFYFCSTHRDRSLQVAVSTSGKGPKLANLVRRHIAEHLPHRVGEAIDQVGILRAKLRTLAPGPEVGPKRMQWMSRVCEQWKMEDLATLDERAMQIVLDGFKDNLVYSHNQVLDKLKAAATASSTVQDSTNSSQDNNDNSSSSTKTDDIKKSAARLVLVGAGPGDPELLTLKAARLLASADLVVADRLIPTEVIDLAKGEVRIAPKKRTVLPIEQQQPEQSDQESLPKTITSDYIQDQLNDWCLQGLKEGKTVVRLKQGDPFIFGRGAEEILFFREHGFEAEVVPGISSALSAPLAANIPLTHRGSADQVVITTAQAKGGVLPDNFPTYDAKKTVVILMGVGKAQEISDLMRSAKLGWPADVPVVVVENAHCANERAMDATLETLAQVVEDQKAVPPSVFVVGWAGNVLRKA